MNENNIKKIFIDGSAGTTGLRIRERLESRQDVELMLPGEDMRKDKESRIEAVRESDITFLCLPDDIARETAELAADADAVIIDTSTAHRTAQGWTYGFAELHEGSQRELIRSSKRISNPGCHASGFIALVSPLTERGLIDRDATLSCFSITGYSGGGKKMISDYESASGAAAYAAPRQYALGQEHKHLKEMQTVTGLSAPPIFSPIVADYYCGMEVTVPLFAEDLNGSMDDIKAAYVSCYGELSRDGDQPNAGGLISFCEHIDDNGFISAAHMHGRDDMLISVEGNSDRMLLIAVFDNLGKGASGAAIQNMNIVMGAVEKTGLVTAPASADKCGDNI